MSTHLVDELTAMDVVRDEDLRPKLRLAALDEVTSLLLEHRVLIGDRNELFVAEALRVCDIRKVGVTRLAELADHERLIQLKQRIERF